MLRSALTLAVVLLSHSGAHAGALKDEIAGLMKAMGPRKGVVAISVRDSDGNEVVNIKGDQPVMPASNQKLLTSGTALVLLGPHFNFETRLLRSGDRLTVVGDGDPSFGDPEVLSSMTYTDAQGQKCQGMTIDALLALWTDAVREAGMTSVRELVVDDRVFDRSNCHVDWPVDQLHEPYCAEVSGLNFHANHLDFWAVPSPRGAEITRIEPACTFVPIRNATTPGKTRDDGLWIAREADVNSFTVRGFLRQALKAPVSVSIDAPPDFFGKLLAERLRTAGVAVGTVRVIAAEEPPSTGSPIGPVIRTPIEAIVRRCNVDSQNLYAECLLKRVGRQVSDAPGSWTNGCEALERLVSGRVGGTAGLNAADGSGLSRENRVTASLMTGWISHLTRDSAVARPFLASLAVGGTSGTVQKRFRDLDPNLATVRCKTGYIDGVCALSGVVDCTNGHQPTFSVICNSYEGDGVGKAKQLQEAVAKAIARTYGKLPERSLQPQRPALGGG
ncbi:MAG: D-alanyl-D-alanine carboxypeptidase/D-alanyl-D-alanine-endopeptidase [Planctomycetes bacterium]|nr:D-alanyl-D-alanine carboxypeptidase/D-alanyl-D-alanine-endopeptidase [Planctomycetota bacterium]